MAQKTLEPVLCPVCGSYPITEYRSYNLYCGEYNCYCLTCRNTRKLRSAANKLEDKFGYGAYSQSSKSSAIRNWNQMCYRLSARVLRESLKPPKIIDIVEMLEDKNASSQQISNVKHMLQYWDVLLEYVKSKVDIDPEAMRLSKLLEPT